MRVLVTGGTGFVGSHSVRALVDAGHEVRLLVRSPDRIEPALGPHGLDGADHVVGDVMDSGAVGRALDGCDAVVHAANVYSLDARRAQEMLEVNPGGTEIVLRAAHERGLDPIVHVSTTVALLPSDGRVLTADSPLGTAPGAYARSKVAAERIARELQDAGAPVVIVSPGAVLGPHDPHISEMVGYTREIIANRLPTLPPGTTPAVDVRDVAAVIAAALQPGRGPRRYLAVGGDLSLRDLAGAARQLTGRRIPTVPIPDRAAVAAGRAGDIVQRVLPVRLPFNREGPWILADSARADASATERELGIRFQPIAQSIADTVRWLAESGTISARQAGKLSP